MMSNRFFVVSFSIIAVVISFLIFSCKSSGKHDPVRDGFINPPDSAKPGVYWYIMDGNLNKEAITADLESMKKAGIGYALFLEVNVGVPRGKIDFLSDKWQQLFTYAVREAERLGIRIILGSGPGWAGSGGPWVKPEQSMMHLVSFDTTLTGPAVINIVLPRPKPRTPFFGEESLTPDLKKLRDEWYEDVRVLAFPAPEKRSRIENLDEKALFVRAPYTSQPGVAPFINAKKVYEEIPRTTVNRDRIIELTNLLKLDGSISWIVPPGKWVILRMGKRNNGAVTRPAPFPGLGFESDKFDTAAFRVHYDSYTGKLISRVQPVKVESGGGWTMIHIDSWEMGAQNWSKNFMEQFIKRRGYDPLLFLPVLDGFIVNSLEESERFLWDIRQTSNELIIENHAGFFKELGKRNGLTLSIEPYDMNPASDLDLGAVADVPMGEFWSNGFGFNSAFSCIEASSIGHVTGKPVVAAEAFTAGDTEAWKLYPGNMKNQTDWALAMGINRFVFHTFAHKSFIDNLRPGMTMGPYGVHYDRGQTWWPMVKEYHKYLTRCQFVLSQGRAVSDVLYLTAEGAPNVFVPPLSALDGTDTLPDKRSYSFDGCSPVYLIRYASAQDSKIVFPSGASYRILVLPETPVMTPELLNKIEQLLRGGITIIGYPPFKSPSLTNYPACDNIVKKLSESIWNKSITAAGTDYLRQKHGTSFVILPGDKLPPDSRPAENRIYPSWEMTKKVLKENNVREDFVSHGDIRYCHRVTRELDIYFISNRTGKKIADSCVFRDGSLKAELWDPLTGEIRKLKGIANKAKGFILELKLEPFQSYFIIFYHTKDLKSHYDVPGNNFPENKPVLELKTPWTVKFDTSLGGPEKVVFDTLADWTSRKEEGIKYFSGIAKYSCSFNLPDSINPRRGNSLYLDLGKVKNMAHIILNGRDLGIVWTAPFLVSVDGTVRKNENKLEIEVANLWINRLIGDESKPWDGVEDGRWPDWLLNGLPRTSGRYTFTTHHFYKKDDPLSESGLIGPVRVMKAYR